MSHARRIASLLCEVLAGEGRGLHANENGMIAMITVIVVLFFAVLIGLVLNVGYTAREKVEVQNAADAVASSAALWQARGLNAVTAGNHVMGELTALTVLQISFGGPELDKGQSCDTEASRNMSQALQGEHDAPDAMLSEYYADFSTQLLTLSRHQHRAGATIFDSRMTLEYLMWQAVFAHRLATVIKLVPGLGAFGIVLDTLALGMRYKIMQEWEGLDILERGVASMAIARRVIEENVLPLVQMYLDFAVQAAPKPIAQSVQTVAEQNHVTATLFPKPGTISLPVEKEASPGLGSAIPVSNSPAQGSSKMVADVIDKIEAAEGAEKAVMDILGPLAPTIKSLTTVLGLSPPDGPKDKGFPDNPSYSSLPKINQEKEEKSQFVRATYPWVNARRAPIRGFMDGPAFMVSMSSKWYLHWTNRYTLAKAHELRTRAANRLAMYVMKFSQQDGQGKERWTRSDGSHVADRLFCVTAFVHRPAKTLTMPAVFGSAAKDGVMAFAQAMVYNANPQLAESGGDAQPQLGWNTLNWKPPTSSNGAWEYGNGISDPNSVATLTNFLDSRGGPAIQLNWQEKLTPVTQLRDALDSPGFEPRFRDVLRRVPDTPEFRNH